MSGQNPQMPYVLARSCAEPDMEFPTLGALARELMALRYATEGRPALRLVRSQLTRNELPGGAVIAVRLVDGKCAGHGSPLGYAFVPNAHGTGLADLERALAAVVERQAA